MKFSWANAAIDVQELCARHDFSFAFIGAVALQHWGEPRVTMDVDLTVFTGFGNEDEAITQFLKYFEPRMENAVDFAQKSRVLLLQSDEGVGIDVALGALSFEQRMVNRTVEIEYLPDTFFRICCAEDFVVTKTFSGRGQDWVDLERALVRQEGKLDWETITAELNELLPIKNAEDHLDQLFRLREQVENYDD
jgi:hypothetical protein